MKFDKDGFNRITHLNVLCTYEEGKDSQARSQLIFLICAVSLHSRLLRESLQKRAVVDTSVASLKSRLLLRPLASMLTKL
jgi:hypothetical protein